MWLRQALDHIKTLTTAISVPLLQVVKIFEGDPTAYKTWERELERYAQMAKLQDVDIPRIAYVTCSGSVEPFIRRYLEECEKESELPTWSELKQLLQKRFGDVSDPNSAMAMLRKMRQTPEENVQIFSERFLRIAEDAYPLSCRNDEPTRKMIEKQLVDIFCDSLYYDYLRLKVMREDPKDFETAVNIAMNEQNLRKRFYLRSGDELTSSFGKESAQQQNSPNYGSNYRSASLSRSPWPSKVRSENRVEEPMDVDHLRKNVCYKCRQPGHKSRDCPRNTRQTNNPRYGPNTQRMAINAAETSPSDNRRGVGIERRETPEWVKRAECWSCHAIGHIQRNCPNRRAYSARYNPSFSSRGRGRTNAYASRQEN